MHTDFEKYRYSAYKCRHSYKGVDTLDKNIDPFASKIIDTYWNLKVGTDYTDFTVLFLI